MMPLRFAVSLLLPSLFLGTIIRAQESTELVIDPRPVNIAPKPGRLVGWGSLSESRLLEDTLPTGWDAEGFIQVAAEAQRWQALHQDGWVLTHSGQKLHHEAPVTQIAITGNEGHWIHLLADGTVRTGGHFSCQPPPDGLTDVIQVEAQSAVFLALRKDGTIVLWHRKDPNANEYYRGHKWTEGGLPSTGIRSLQARGSMVMVQTEDGSTRTNHLYGRRGFDNAPGDGSPIVAGSVGALHLVALTADGQVQTKGDKASDPARAEAVRVPADLKGPFVRVTAGSDLCYAQRPDGSWVCWGTARDGQDDVERIRHLLAFQTNIGAKTGFVLGIARSLTGEIDPAFSTSDLVRTELTGLADLLEKASDPVTQFEARYLQELDKLAQAAAAQNLTDLAQVLAEERTHFRDRSRPPAKEPATLARLQAVYRNRAPKLEAERDRQRREVYREGIPRLQQLQDRLTQEQKLSDAVEARRAREELARCVALWEESGERRQPTSVARAGTFVFAPVPPADRIFSIQDPLRPGQLVGWGNTGGQPFSLPREAQRNQYVTVSAIPPGVWIAIQENGRFFCHHITEERMRMGAVPSGVNRLQKIVRISSYFGYLAVDGAGKLVHWGYDNREWNDNVPEVCWNWKGITESAVRALSTDRIWPQVLALHEDGSVSAAGTFYDQESKPWQNHAAGSTDNAQVFVHHSYSGVRKRDGSLLLWNENGILSVPEGFPKVAKVVTNNDLLYALLPDGTVDGFYPLTGSRWHFHPGGLSDVVDLFLHEKGILYVLRADGRWYYWNPRYSSVVTKELTEARGLRRLQVRGDKGRVFGIGIRPM